MRENISVWATTVRWRLVLRIMLWVAGGIATLFLLIQLFYPADRVLPFTQVDGVTIGTQTFDEATATVTSFYADAQLQVIQAVDGSTLDSVALRSTGISIDNVNAQVSAGEYPLWLRLIPSSILWAHSSIPPVQPHYTRDAVALDSYLDAHYSQWCVHPAKNASLAVAGDDLNIIASTEGVSCSRERVRAVFMQAQPSHASLSITVPSSAAQPAMSTADAVTLRERILSAFDATKGLVIETDRGNVNVPTETVLSWLSFDANSDIITYSVDTSAVATYFDDVAARDAADQNVHLANMDASDFVDQLTTYLDTPAADRQPLKISLLAVAVAIDKFISTHSGTYRVSLLELSGQRQRITVEGGSPIITASTYKMFVAFSTIKAVEEGSWAWDTPLLEEFDVASCFELMIAVSDNPCAEALLDHLSFTRVEADAASIGAINTSFQPYDIVSTANDEVQLLSKLEAGALPISATGRARWLDAMENQVYRSGIPSGVSGIRVADKVGFQDELLHDAAIIYSPKGTYILVVLTEYSSWDDIAELARVIEAAR